MILSKHITTLELPRVLEQLADCTSCDDSRRLALSIEPVCQYEKAVRLLNLTVAANTLSNKYGYPVIYRMVNCAGALKRAQLGSRLSLRELLDITLVLRTMRSLDSWKQQSKEIQTALDSLFECLFLERSLENRLTSAIVSEEELDDNASALLSDLRRNIRSTGLRVRSQLDNMIRSTTYQKYLQESIITIRDGRFVIPVKAEYKNDVKGLVHDTSSSGATYFIEPMSVVELNNEIRVLQSKEQQEVDRIIAELSALVGEHADAILSGYDAAVTLDLYFAKSRLGDRMRAYIPTLTDSGETVLKKARHPMIEYERAVPIDIAVGRDYDTLVITGPNTGGKTVAIKTLGLLTLMAMCGLMLPASSDSIVSVYDQVLADIGDEQSIEQSLSTFSSHMVNIIAITETANWRSLVLLDELGAGTDPVEGAALAVSIIETLRKKGAKVAATTHYSEIKMYALETDGVENASCEFDVASLRPTYRLLTGIPGRSNAFLISERLGLSMDIIERARYFVSAENTRFEDVVTELEATRQQLEQEKLAAKKLREEAEQIRRDSLQTQKRLEQSTEKEMARAREQAKRIIEETRLQADILFEELDAIKKEKDKDAFSDLLMRAKRDYRGAMKDLERVSDPVSAKSAAEGDYVLPRPLEKGDIVFVRILNKEGIVLKKPEGQSVLVQAGLIKTSVPISEIMLGGQKKEQKPRGKGAVGIRGVASRATRDIKTQLDLRGQDSEQAILELNAFIDSAVMSGVQTVRIIHGKGTGVLRAAVAQRLKNHRNVASFRLGRYGEGENGVTIAEIK
ncbi:endonuclease MutS2 [Oscillospiraceae bacterium LTW-04]|nr:endonuclease MutS2 [Oscillospiraceae bacterium MB24-C1]